MQKVVQGIPSNQVFRLSAENDLLTVCEQNLQGSSNCLGAIVWNSIDTNANIYNYTLRADAGLTKINVNDHNDSVEEYILPFQCIFFLVIFA